MEEIESLRRHLSAVLGISEALSPSTVSAIAYADHFRGISEGDFPAVRDYKYQSILPEVLVHVRELHQAISDYGRKPEARQKAGKKRNWRAIAVAAKCREIWSEEHVLEDFRRSGRNPGRRFAFLSHEDYEAQVQGRREFEKAVAEFMPMTAHNDAPGPFGRFVEDVFAALAIPATTLSATTKA